jgi:hypothetical protein
MKQAACVYVDLNPGVPFAVLAGTLEWIAINR